MFVHTEPSDAFLTFPVILSSLAFETVKELVPSAKVFNQRLACEYIPEVDTLDRALDLELDLYLSASFASQEQYTQDLLSSTF